MTFLILTIVTVTAIGILIYYHSIPANDASRYSNFPFYFKERLRMKEKMNTIDGRLSYGLRKITVEPVYGNLKQNLGFREFLLRGLDKVKIEMNIACIAHNLQKIWRLSSAKG